MTKKSLKSKSTTTKPRNSSNGVSFNNYSFDLGNLKILTDYINPETKDIIIKLYRSRKFDPKLYEQKPIDLQNNRKQNYDVLTEIQAIQVIKDITLKQKRQLLKTQEEMSQLYLNKTLYIKKNPLEHILRYQKEKFINSQFFLYYNIHQEIDNFERQKEKLLSQKQKSQLWCRELWKKNCLKIEKQIFLSSIVMIIEKFSPQQINTDKKIDSIRIIRSIVIFEQSYSPQYFIKEQLIQLIGEYIYKQKIITALKENFYNPTFITCHDCMKIISNRNYPQHDLNCLKIVEDPLLKDIKSQFAFTPSTFLTKIIKRQYFTHSQQNQKFQHPYIQYHVKPKDKQGLACGRHWCGQCVIKYKRGMNMNHCEFCDRICKCFRCKKFQKLIQLLAHFVEMGGIISDIEHNFMFHRILSQNEFDSNCKIPLSNNENKIFAFRLQLHNMYEYYVKSQRINITKQWNQLKNSEILTGILPLSLTQTVTNSLLFHSDQLKKKNKNNFHAQIDWEQRNYRRLLQIKRSRNIEAKISNLSQQNKLKFQEAHFQQFDLLKRKLQKSKIFKFVNPINNPRITQKSKDVVIVSQSALKKNQKRFHQLIEIQQANPFKRVHQQRAYLKVKRFDQQSKQRNVHQQKESSRVKKQYKKKETFLNEEGIINQNESNQQNQNYGSMWE